MVIHALATWATPHDLGDLPIMAMNREVLVDDIWVFYMTKPQYIPIQRFFFMWGNIFLTCLTVAWMQDHPLSEFEGFSEACQVIAMTLEGFLNEVVPCFLFFVPSGYLT